MQRQLDLGTCGHVNTMVAGLVMECTHRNRYCLSIVMAVTTRGFRPVLRPCSSIFELIMAVVNSVSAAVPAPQHLIFSVI